MPSLRNSPKDIADFSGLKSDYDSASIGSSGSNRPFLNRAVVNQHAGTEVKDGSSVVGDSTNVWDDD